MVSTYSRISLIYTLNKLLIQSPSQGDMPKNGCEQKMRIDALAKELYIPDRHVVIMCMSNEWLYPYILAR
jgi:hypothetical protein